MMKKTTQFRSIIPSSSLVEQLTVNPIGSEVLGPSVSQKAIMIYRRKNTQKRNPKSQSVKNYNSDPICETNKESKNKD